MTDTLEVTPVAQFQVFFPTLHDTSVQTYKDQFPVECIGQTHGLSPNITVHSRHTFILVKYSGDKVCVTCNIVNVG